MEYVIIKEGKHTYWARLYLGSRARDNMWHDSEIATTMWGAKRQIKKLKRRRAYEVKNDLHKVVFKEKV